MPGGVGGERSGKLAAPIPIYGVLNGLKGGRVSEILTPQNGDESSDERPRLVLDTNTVLALWMFRDPALEALRAWIDAGHCQLHTRADALDELRCVLTYPRFGLDPDRQGRIFADYCHRIDQLSPQAAEDTPTPEGLPQCSDKDDQKFLEIAIGSGATYLLTRDKALLRLRKHRQLRNRIVIAQPEALTCAQLHNRPFARDIQT